MPTQPRDYKKSKKGATSAKSWKKKAQTELELPSGNVALVRAMRITDMLAEGFFPENLRGEILGQIGKAENGVGKPGDPTDGADAIQKMFEDPEKMSDMFEIFDKVLLKCVVEPQVLPVPADDEDRDEELLYVDEVDLEDKVFIFQWAVGGDDDLTSFREEFSESVGSLENK